MTDTTEKFDGQMNPYPHSEKGVEVRTTALNFFSVVDLLLHHACVVLFDFFSVH